GKSTLLKLLAGRLAPNEGAMSVQGRVSAILELGTGFHPEMTGLENIWMGCALMGLSRRETEAVLPEIVDFSELGDFVAQPVKTYSSGMYVRLAFSVVTCVDPEVLVVDEALSVGDGHFQKKSIDRMRRFREEGKTLVFCSHNLYHVKELCAEAIWLDHGRVRLHSDAGSTVDAYQDFLRAKNGDRRSDAPPTTTQAPPAVQTAAAQTLPAELLDVTLLDFEEGPDGQPLYRTHRPFRVRVRCRVNSVSPDDVYVGIVIRRNDEVQCYGVSTAFDGQALVRLDGSEYGIVYEIERLPLLSGQYGLEIWLIDSTSVHVYDARERCCKFSVRQSSVEVGMTWMDHRWAAP
ncbi:MAG: ABC transporter ATP-binding protein, partial [Pseudomonadota bacterium]|nr:ABC transporter ATP-binding protein [Pseudomonadota bacterium]